MPFFVDELRENKVLWPNCVEFEIIKKYDDEVIERIEGLPQVKGLSKIKDEAPLEKLLNQIKNSWNITLSVNRYQTVTFHPS